MSKGGSTVSEEQIQNLQETCDQILAVDVRSFPKDLMRVNPVKTAVPFLLEAQEFVRTLDVLGLENARFLKEDQLMTLNAALRLVSDGLQDVMRIRESPRSNTREAWKAADQILKLARETYDTVTDFRESNMRIYSLFYCREKGAEEDGSCTEKPINQGPKPQA